jgi:hypothetical protein
MPMTDSSPSDWPFSITPNDAADLTRPIRGLSVSVAGNVKVTRKDGTTDTLPLPAGGPFPMAVSRIWAAGTTATGLCGFP